MTPAYGMSASASAKCYLSSCKTGFPKKKTLLIEQPEIHLHPAHQAELGDMFIRSALGEQRNTILLETHSEHLMLSIHTPNAAQTTNKDSDILPEGAIAKSARNM